MAEDDEGNLISLSPAQQDRYLRKFAVPDVIKVSEVGDTIVMTLLDM